MDRRTFLARTGAAAAAAGVVAAVPLSGVADAATATDEKVPDVAPPEHDVIAHVRDVRTGEIAVFTGTTETIVRDRTLAARLVRAASTDRG